MKRVVLSSSMLLALVLSAACGGDDSKKADFPQGGGDAGADVATAADAPPSPPDAPVAEAPPERAELSGDAKAAYQDGYSAWKNGDLATAKARFSEATRKDPKGAAAFYSLGCVLERLGDNAGAQAAYKGAYSAKGDFFSAIGAYAVSLARTGNPQDATTFLTDKRQKFPNSPALANYLAEVRSLAKDSAGAQLAAQDALRLDSNYKEAMVTIARDHHRNGREDLAKYALTAILDGFGQSNPARDPKNAEAHLLRGLIDRAAGRRLSAKKEFEAAQATRPDLIEATIQIAAMKLESGDAQGARSLLETAVRYAPNQPLAHLNLGDCYRLLGQLADAKKELDTALAQDSTLQAAHYALGLMFLTAPSYPGMSANDQVSAAIRELNQYKQMRGPKAPPGVSDDIDDLITRANKKKDDLNPAPAASAAPPAKKGK